MKSLNKIVVATAITFTSISSFAASPLSHTSNSQILVVKATVPATCTLQMIPPMDFNQLKNQQEATSTTEVSVTDCYTADGNTPVAYISTNTGEDNQYIMTATDKSGATINYGLYTDSSYKPSEMITPYNDGKGHGQEISLKNGQGSATIYGEVPAGQDLSADADKSFTQNVTVEVEF
ncbi:spore coat protein U domain-containing protein [Vibrio sp. S4M6]|uniref:spore coat protein U domain-containing protein n=1 Tax=Vibrio sinus TaxID=2946865 RepID=UPI00202A8515|nr:spore coat protein U domain-containing protein [Vibrio sinus]MCL9780121.1 spore coat protein U domain-containing protein [Vibrio sinus]